MQKSKQIKSPLVLLILDGWGLAPPSKGNAITLAKTPTMTSLWKKYPHTTLKASGLNVGLPKSQTGNSEAGHINLGAGRLVLQDSVIIDKGIEDGTFFKNPAFIEAIRHSQRYHSNIHLMGLLSGYQSPHSSPNHLDALLKLVRDNFKGNVFLHLFTDGRDAPKYEGLRFLNKLLRKLRDNERIVTICGRFYAMDRKKAWDRIEQAYDAMTICGESVADGPIAAITQAYNRGESDEFIKPTVIVPSGKSKVSAKVCQILGGISSNDSIIFFNLRSDRARELTKAFVQPNFNELNQGSFKRKKVLNNLRFIVMTDFGPDLGDILTAYPTKDIIQTLPMMLRNLKQLYISESEKYAHITYFFNGGYADPVGGEARIMVPSPDVKSYDEKPEMSILKVVEFIKKAVQNNKYDFITANFANPDMVGHTGNLKAGIKAVEAVDKALGMVIKEVMKVKGRIIVTADHGNIEEMINLKTGEIDTEHSDNPVPFILVDHFKAKKNLPEGILADVAPTILKVLDIEQPKEMNGKSLI